MPVIISPKLKLKKYGLDKVIYNLEGLFLNSRYLRDRFYQIWLGLSEYDKTNFMREVKRIIRKELLGQDFYKAIAKDILGEKGIETKTHLYYYLKTRVYGGDAIELLMDLRDVIEEKELPKRYRTTKIGEMFSYKPTIERVRMMKRDLKIKKFIEEELEKKNGN
jgi:hypothetical protein